MISITTKMMISLTIIPLIIIVNSQLSLGSIRETKIAASPRNIETKELKRLPSKQEISDHLTVTNLEHQLSLLNDTEITNSSLIKLEANRTNKLWQLNHLLTAARNEKTKECRASGLC